MATITLSQIALEAMKENLHIANLAMKEKKGNGGCYGVPTTILLSAIIDTMGSFFNLNQTEGKFALYNPMSQNWQRYVGRTRQHYDEIWNQFRSIIQKYGVSKKDWIGVIYEIYRCQLTHNGTMAPNTCISIQKTGKKEILCEENGVKTLYLQPFYNMVEELVNDFIQRYENNIKNDTTYIYSTSDSPSLTGTTSSNIAIYTK